jgi:all-trans-retinol dehydrogenase (NAD+)
MLITRDLKTTSNIFFSVDVTNREKVLEAGSKVLKDVGVVTILLNNAGIMPQHDFLKHTEGEIRKIIEINTVAHFWMFQAFLPKMIENNRGHIVAMSSMAGIMGFQNLVPYCGSKFAVRGIQEALSEELRCKTNGQSEVS